MQISILTCGKGQEVYSTFGHSAIRIKDEVKGIDDVYNYGLFDFGDPNFVPNFINGYLNYMVGKETFDDFIYQYQYQNRSVSEQVLNLDSIQTKKIIDFLEWNVKEENKYYRYDFLRNNCATKIIEVLQKANISICQEPFIQSKSYRDLIHEYASHSVPWIDWGMDICLGYRCDQNTTRIQRCFLPDFVAQTIDMTKNKDGNPLVFAKNNIVNSIVVDNNKYIFYMPFGFAFLVLSISLLFYVKQLRFRRLFYFIYFTILGFLGLIVCYEWFFTEHFVTKYNYNLLWLNPISFVLAWSILVKNQVVKRFMVVLIAFTSLICLFLDVTKIAHLHLASLMVIISTIINCISIQKHIELK